MTLRTKIQGRLLASTIIASTVLVASPALAQGGQPAATAEEEGSDQAIVVTGTLVRNPNLVSSSPVNVVGEEEIELQQANVAEELLRELPGAVPSIGSAVNNGNGGNSFVNLRGLGANRNVVLIDGVRLVPATLSGLFDLNNVPLALVQRVDVLTGGASTTYGADAVSGVVNFITRQDFAGIDINLSEQITEQGDGNTFRADLTIGANFDDGRGNATFSVGYQEADPVYQGARDFGLFTIDSTTGGSGGSGTTTPSRFLLGPGVTRQVTEDGTGFQPTAAFTAFNFNPFNVYQTPFERFNMYGAARYEVSDAIEIYTRGLFSKNTVDTIIAPSGSFGIAVTIPLNNPFLTAAQRNAFCAVDVNPSATVVTRRFTQAECDAAAAPGLRPGQAAYREIGTGAGSATQTTTGSGTNRPVREAFVPFDVNGDGAISAGEGFNPNPLSQLFRRAVEVGPRISSYSNTVFDYRAGARGGITDSIDWDVFGSYGEADQVQEIQNYTLNSRVRQSLLAGGGATPVCFDTANACTPVNFFGATGNAGFGPAQVDFLNEISTVRTRVTLAQARGTISGDFGWNLPWAAEPVSFAVGGEFREYTAAQSSDALAQGGDLGGAGGAAPNIDGGFNVYEAFGELIVPIVSDRPFFDELTVEGGVRYSSYNIDAPGNPGFTTTTWKVGGTWAPIDGLRFRGNYARAVRAPNIAELFSPVNTGLTSLATEPCASINGVGVRFRAAPTGELRAICLAQGANAGNVDTIQLPISGQAQATGGGNLNLEPERSRSWTVGVVFQPDFIPGLSLSLDYYNILIRGAVSSPTSGDVITGCFGGGDGRSPAAGASATEACTSIRRNPLNGSLSGDPSDTPGLPLTLSNLGRIETSGVDFSINYRRDLDIFGGVGLALNGQLTWQDEQRFQATPTSINRECIGFYSPDCGQPFFEWQWSLRTTLTFDNIDVSLLWRHLDNVIYEPAALAASGPLFRGTLGAAAGPLAGQVVDFNRIGSYDYFDLTTRFQVDDHLTITLAVQNLFDKLPPLVGNNAGSTAFNSPNTFPSTYDTLGRRFVATARIRF